MQVTDFTADHLPEATALMKENYREEVLINPALPPAPAFPSLEQFAQNGMGAAAFENGRLIGFLGAPPFDNAHTGTARGTFSPIHAHGVQEQKRGEIYQRLYQQAAQKWVEQGVTSHAVSLYAHDRAAQTAFWEYGFGLRCLDAIRTLEPIPCPAQSTLQFRRAEKAALPQIKKLCRLLDDHMAESPCFMYKSDDSTEEEDTLFAAFDKNTPVAYVKILTMGGAETFVSEQPEVANICGAYCLPEYRGKGVYTQLLGHVIRALAPLGFRWLGVDYESINPAAFHFWQKHFTPYTHSVVRRIDENILTRAPLAIL